MAGSPAGTAAGAWEASRRAPGKTGGEGWERKGAEGGNRGKECIKVACRIRPAEQDEPRVWVVSDNKRVMAIPPPPAADLQDAGPYSSPRSRNSNLPCFTFDQAFGENAKNQEVYTDFCQQAVKRALDGCKASLLLYGQTGAGKTHTICGSKEDPGVFAYAVRDIFAAGEGPLAAHFACSLSVLAIYNERAFDMLNPAGPQPLEMVGPEVLRDKNRQPMTKCQVASAEEALATFHFAEQQRRYAETRKNPHSSRSHTIFILEVVRAVPGVTTTGSPLSPPQGAALGKGDMEGRPPEGGFGQGSPWKERGSETRLTGGAGQTRGPEEGENCDPQSTSGELGTSMSLARGTLYIVDLAGSESIKESGATGERKRETEIINKSLLALTEVLGHLSRGRKPEAAPYRRSMLTRVLQPCLGGDHMPARPSSPGERAPSPVRGGPMTSNGRPGIWHKPTNKNNFAAMVFCIDPLNLRVSEKTLKYGLITKAIQIQYGITIVTQREESAEVLTLPSSQLAVLQKEIDDLKAENARLEEQRLALLMIWRRGHRPWQHSNSLSPTSMGSPVSSPGVKMGSQSEGEFSPSNGGGVAPGVGLTLQFSLMGKGDPGELSIYSRSLPSSPWVTPGRGPRVREEGAGTLRKSLSMDLSSQPEAVCPESPKIELHLEGSDCDKESLASLEGSMEKSESEKANEAEMEGVEHGPEDEAMEEDEEMGVEEGEEDGGKGRLDGDCNDEDSRANCVAAGNSDGDHHSPSPAGDAHRGAPVDEQSPEDKFARWQLQTGQEHPARPHGASVQRARRRRSLWPSLSCFAGGFEREADVILKEGHVA